MPDRMKGHIEPTAGTADATDTPIWPLRGHRAMMEKVLASLVKRTSHAKLILNTGGGGFLARRALVGDFTELQYRIPVGQG
jgi:hypothetical protein